MIKILVKTARHYLKDQSGKIDMSMMAEVFALRMFILVTIIAILMTEKEGASSSKTAEMKTPEITLSKSGSGGSPSTSEKSTATVSARRNANGAVEYFVGEHKTGIDGIAGVLKGKKAGRVELRLDESLTNGVTVNILGQLQEAGVKEITYIFLKKGGSK